MIIVEKNENGTKIIDIYVTDEKFLETSKEAQYWTDRMEKEVICSVVLLGMTFLTSASILDDIEKTEKNETSDLCFSNKLRCGLISQSYFFVFVLVKGGEFHLDFWILLVPKMVISKLSGNTVRSTHPRLQKAF